MTGAQSHNKLNILFLIADMQGGGAQRVASILCNAWAARGDKVTMVTNESPDTQSFYPLSDDIDKTGLNLLSSSQNSTGKGLLSNFKRIVRVSKLIRDIKPDVVLCFGYDVSVIGTLAALGLHKNVLACERSDPALYPSAGIWQKLRDFAYGKAARVIVQTQDAADVCNRLNSNVDIIPNPVIRPDTDGDADIKAPASRYIATMGRMSNEKGHDILIDAFATIAQRHKDVDLLLIGDGPNRPAYEAMADNAGLAGRVHFAGQSKNPFPVLKQAAVFVLPSRFEGFPNALAEAMALGLPCVSTSSAVGAKALVDYGRNGLIVPGEDPAAMAEAIDSLLSDEVFAKQLGDCAAEVTDYLGLANVLEMWDRVITANGKADG